MQFERSPRRQIPFRPRPGDQLAETSNHPSLIHCPLDPLSIHSPGTDNSEHKVRAHDSRVGQDLARGKMVFAELAEVEKRFEALEIETCSQAPSKPTRC